MSQNTYQANQYWDQWMNTLKNGFQPAEQWTDFLKNMQSAMTQKAGIPDYAQYQKYFEEAGKNYIQMLQQFATQTPASLNTDEALQGWLSDIRRFYEEMLATNLRPFDSTAAYQPFVDGMAKMNEFVAQFGKNFSVPLWQNQMNNNAGGFNFDPFGLFASMPGIGYTREKQEDLNALYKAAVAFEQKSREYNAEMARVGLEAAIKFQEFIINPPKDQAPLTSLKAVYSKWVDISEEIYARFAMSERYTKLYGDVVNALMTYKNLLNAQIDQAVAQFNLPTRAEVDSVHKRVHELKRELAELKAVLNVKKEKAPKAKVVKKTEQKPLKSKSKSKKVNQPKRKKG